MVQRWIDMEKKFECVDCPFYDSKKVYNGYTYDYIDWCSYHDIETGCLGWCEREETYEDKEQD